MWIMFLEVLINVAALIFHVFIFKPLRLDFRVLLIFGQPDQDLFISPWDQFLNLPPEPLVFLPRIKIIFLLKFGDVPCKANQNDLRMISI